MNRYKLTIEFDGRPFVGWQRQANGLSVQQALEEGIRGFTQAEATVHGAGRTDAGVHATAMIAHVDLPRDYRPDVVRDAANAHIKPLPVAILAVERVGADFQARFSAVRRHYLYRICNRRAPLTWGQGLVWHVARRLDAEAMHAAAQRLLGRHDFTTFRASECQAASPDPHPGAAGRGSRRRGNPHSRRRPLIPAPSGALDGRFAGACRQRQMAGR
jgi:tRNA pseudouridine38-40 synthase